MNEEIKKKMEEAKLILQALGLPKRQTNDRSVLVFIALANINPTETWADSRSPLLTTAEIMDFIRDFYGKDYKPNTRESVRKETLHQFEQARIVDRNRDDPSRPTNSSKNNYSLNQPIVDILKEFPSGNWQDKLKKFQELTPSLIEEYGKRIDLHKIPIKLPDGTEIKLSPGKHNQLHADVINEFAPRFIGEAGVLLYLGDTASSRVGEGGKLLYQNTDILNALGVPAMAHEKLPDIVIYDNVRNWLFLIEAVASTGPISPKRWIELEKSLESCTIGRVYVTAFPDMNEFRKFSTDIAWETEVWISELPDHMIHFNGDRFLGPHIKE